MEGGAEGSGSETAAPLSFSMRMTVYGIQKAFPSVRNVTCSDVDARRRNQSRKIVFVDVRPEEEFRVSHIQGAVRVEPNSQPDLRELGITPDDTVVCYCSVGYRSSDMAQRLYRVARTADISLDVYNMAGGIFQWAIEERDIVDNDENKAAEVHPYSSVWGMLLPGKLRASL